MDFLIKSCFDNINTFSQLKQGDKPVKINQISIPNVWKSRDRDGGPDL